MKKKLQAITAAIIIGSLMVPTNVFASEIGQGNDVASNEAVSPRISVSKYVEIERYYVSVGYVPKNYAYSYYDHDYKTELHGLLPLVESRPSGSLVLAVFAGYCSGSI